MACRSFGDPGPSKAEDEPTSNFRKFDLDVGTEIWRRALEARAKSSITARSQLQAEQPRTVEGGLPPHLLFKKTTNKSRSGTEASKSQQHNTKPLTEAENVARRPLFQQPDDVFPVVNVPAKEPQFNYTTRPRPTSPLVTAQANHDGNPQPAWSTIESWCNHHSQMQSPLGHQSLDDMAPVPEDKPKAHRKFKPGKEQFYDRQSLSLPETVSSVKSKDSAFARNHKPGSAGQLSQSTSAESDRSLQDGSSEGKEDEDMEFSKFGGNVEACQQWLMDLPSPPKVFFLEKDIERHQECDVDTVSGFLNAPIDYPDTHIDPQDKSTKKEIVRRLNGTVELKSFVDAEKKKKKHRQAHQVADNQSEKPWATVGGGTAPGIGALGFAKRDEPEYRSSFPVNSLPTVARHFFLRPVQEEDLPQILEIYNWEVVNGVQALDNQPLVLKEIQRIMSHCRISEVPFIVAVAGTPAEAAARKEVPTPVLAHRGHYRVQRKGPYSQYNQMLHPNFKSNNTSSQEEKEQQTKTKPEPDKILGFGFLKIPVPGLAGNIHHSVHRFEARAHVYVDANHRRKGIGRALLHKLTRCCSIYSIDMGTYEWFDPTNSRVYDVPAFNPRNYVRLFVEMASRSEDDPDTQWCSKFLDSEGFVFLSASEKTRKLGDEEEGQWLDNLVWQLACQDHKAITENGLNPYNL